MNSVPGRIIEVSSEGNNRVGLVEFDGRRRTIYLSLVPQAKTGDFVRFHAGFATELVGSDQARNPDEQDDGSTKYEDRKAGFKTHHAYRLLSELNPEQLGKLIPLAEERQYTGGEVIFPSGAKSTYLHLIVSGDVALEAVSGDQTRLIQLLHDGDAMGWSAFIGESLTHFQARALTPVFTIAFPGDQLRAACGSDPALGYALIKRLMELVTERLDALRMKLAETSNG